MRSRSKAAVALDVRVLGPLELVAGDRVTVLARGRESIVLAVLALNVGTVVTVETLIEHIWDDRPPSTATKSIQNTVVAIRKRIEDDPSAPSLLLRRGAGYVLALPRSAVDAHRFSDALGAAREQRASGDMLGARDSALAALSLWRGDAVADLGPSARAVAERERLAVRRIDACELWIEVELALGRHHEVVGQLDALVRAHPFRESLWALLMVALYRCGRNSDALAAFTQARQVLSEELGLEPSPELQDVQQRVLRQDASLAPPLRLEPSTGSLPTPRTPIVGRDADLAGIVTALDTSAVVTLVGPAGVGKTRLALAAGEQLRMQYAGAVWMFELSTLRDAGRLDEALATALGVDIFPSQDIRAALVTSLQHHRLLLVVDNCEHLVEAAADLIETLVTRCPALTVLATSREPLRLEGEVTWSIEPLPVPGDETEVGTAPASRLLVQLVARRGRPPLSAAAVVEVCRRLDGLPLALELAAGCLAVMTEADLLAGLDARFEILTGGRRTAGSRQETLRASIEWSFKLLERREQAVFEMLSVFAGGFDAESAEALAAAVGFAPHEVRPALRRLIEQSMIVLDHASGRYGMLESLRAYALQRLEASGGLALTRASHCQHYAALTEKIAAGVQGEDELDWSRLVSSEFDNLRAAFRYASSEPGGDAALRLVGNLMWDAIWRNRVEVFWWARQLMDYAEDVHPDLPRVAALAAWAAAQDGRREEARDFAERGLRAASDQTGTPVGMCWGMLGLLEMRAGRPLDARPRFARALELADEPDHRALGRVGLALSYAFVGDAETALEILSDADAHGGLSARTFVQYARAEAYALIDPARARRIADAALVEAQRLGAEHVAGALIVVRATLHARDGDSSSALAALADLLRFSRQRGQWARGWTALDNLAELLLDLGRVEEAVVLHHAAAWAADANPVFGVQAARWEHLLDRVREVEGADRLAAWADQGKAMPAARAFDYAQDTIKGLQAKALATG